jgi:hypothetical protein
MTKLTIGDRKEPRNGNGPDCEGEHDCLMKSIMNKMTIRFGMMLLGCVGLVTTITMGIADSQVTKHKAEIHYDLVDTDDLQDSEEKLSEKIDEVKNDLQNDIEKIQNSQVRMEDKMDHMMEVLMQSRTPQ